MPRAPSDHEEKIVSTRLVEKSLTCPRKRYGNLTYFSWNGRWRSTRFDVAKSRDKMKKDISRMQGDGPQATNLKFLYEEAAAAEVLFNRMGDRRDLLRGTWIFPQRTYVEEPWPTPAGSGLGVGGGRIRSGTGGS